MTAVLPLGVDAVLVTTEQIGYWEDVRRRFFRNKLAIGALTVLVLLILLAIIGPIVARGDYTTGRLGYELKRPGDHRWILGTDSLGRDMFKRVVRGIGISLSLAAGVTIATTLLGMILGGLAGYLGGIFDTVVSRFIDAVYAIPYVLIGISIIAIFGRSFWTLLGSLVAVGWLSTARLFRAAVLQIRGQDFIEAARATGADTKRILLNHVVPNALPPVIVSIAFSIAGSILAESIYSFLAIGFTEPRPALGVMLLDARKSGFEVSPHILFVPAVVLILLTLSIAIIGDALRDALDPKLRGAG
jgi:oligopeptide transport system permease protein